MVFKITMLSVSNIMRARFINVFYRNKEGKKHKGNIFDCLKILNFFMSQDIMETFAIPLIMRFNNADRKRVDAPNK